LRFIYKQGGGNFDSISLLFWSATKGLSLDNKKAYELNIEYLFNTWVPRKAQTA